MYSESDLESAVAAGVLSPQEVDALRTHVSAQRATSMVDEEDFRLLSGFNDIFVAIAGGSAARRRRMAWRRDSPSDRRGGHCWPVMGIGGVFHAPEAHGTAEHCLPACLCRWRLFGAGCCDPGRRRS